MGFEDVMERQKKGGTSEGDREAIEERKREGEREEKSRRKKEKITHTRTLCR